MTDEVINKDGTSGWTSVGTGISLTAGTLVQASTDSFADLLASIEEDYPQFELRLQVTSGTPTENNTVDVHLRMSDGTNEEPAPSGDYAPHYRGVLILDNATGYYFSDPMALTNKDATIYLRSNEASTTLTVSLFVKAKTLAPAA